MNLSKDLIGSAQKRVVAWQRVSKNTFDLTFGIELNYYLMKNEQSIKNRFNEGKLMEAMKINL